MTNEITDAWWKQQFGQYWVDLTGDFEIYKPLGKKPELHMEEIGGPDHYVRVFPMDFASREELLDFIETFRKIVG